MSNPSLVVLDSSALLTYMYAERGWERVEAVFQGALMSSVNYAEVLSKVAGRGGDPQETDSEFGPQLLIVPFSSEHALAAAVLRPLTRHLGLSLGDRACLALGLERGANMLTADEAWAGLDPSYRIEILR